MTLKALNRVRDVAFQSSAVWVLAGCPSAGLSGSPTTEAGEGLRGGGAARGGPQQRQQRLVKGSGFPSPGDIQGGCQRTSWAEEGVWSWACRSGPVTTGASPHACCREVRKFPRCHSMSVKSMEGMSTNIHISVHRQPAVNCSQPQRFTPWWKMGGLPPSI